MAGWMLLFSLISLEKKKNDPGRWRRPVVDVNSLGVFINENVVCGYYIKGSYRVL